MKLKRFFGLTIALALLPTVTLANASDPARDILAATGVKGGLVVHLGCGDGSLTAALGASERYLVHGLDTDARNVAKARETIAASGRYGRVSIDRLDGARLPYADNLVNLLVADDLGDVSMDEVKRALQPGGVAYVKQGGKWEKTVNAPNDEMDEWTHWLHGADGNPVSRDRVVAPPNGLQWIAGPTWMRHHDTAPSISSIVSANGRVFSILDEGPPGVDGSVDDKWFLVARDAFNGVLLWKRPMPEWGWSQWTVNWHVRNNLPFQVSKRLVAVDDTVYTTTEFNAPLSALDAATGEVKHVYKDTAFTDEILYHDGLLVLSVNETAHIPSDENHTPITKSVAVVKADTGEIVWKKGAYKGLRAKSDSIEPLSRLELTVSGDRVFLVDEGAIVALDLATGDEAWRQARPEAKEFLANFNTRMSELCVLVADDGVLLFMQPQGGISWHTVPGKMIAYDAKDGKPLWERVYGGWVHNTQPDVFVIDGTLWAHEHLDLPMKGRAPAMPQSEINYALLGLDLRTGKETRRIDTSETFNVGHHHRCYRTRATERFLLMSRRGVEFIDLESGDNDLNHWTRGGCHIGVMPSNGLLYSTPHPCSCYIATKLNGFYALTSESIDATRDKNDGFERGPAYGKVKVGKVEAVAGEWPTFRGDALRSGQTTARVPAKLDDLWSVDVGGRPGPLSLANGKVFVPIEESHTVVALDAATGKRVWSFIADGRVDTPPTIHGPLALFGSAGGSVHCVRASDGELVWRRRLGPTDRLIGARGQLESAWPVHGSVLVQKNVAYVAAGRSTYLDGGIHLTTLDPSTGDIVDHHVEFTSDGGAGDAKTLPGMLSDILVSDGAAVWMRQNQVFGAEPSGRGALFATGGLRDDQWFNRTTWGVGGQMSAQLLVFDNALAYGVARYASTSRSKGFTAGAAGYSVFAKSRSAKAKSKGRGKNRTASPEGKTGEWSIKAPVMVTGMVLSADTLFLAGAPDEADLASIEGANGGVMRAVSSTDGKTLAERKLESPPIFDGMIAAFGRLYLSTVDGKVMCLGERQ